MHRRGHRGRVTLPGFCPGAILRHRECRHHPDRSRYREPPMPSGPRLLGLRLADCSCRASAMVAIPINERVAASPSRRIRYLSRIRYSWTVVIASGMRSPSRSIRSSQASSISSLSRSVWSGLVRLDSCRSCPQLHRRSVHQVITGITDAVSITVRLPAFARLVIVFIVGYAIISGQRNHRRRPEAVIIIVSLFGIRTCRQLSSSSGMPSWHCRRGRRRRRQCRLHRHQSVLVRSCGQLSRSSGMPSPSVQGTFSPQGIKTVIECSQE